MLASAIGRPSTRRGPRHLRWAVLLITALAMFLLPHTLSSYNGDIGAYSLSALGAPASSRADELPPPTEAWRSADHLIVVAGHAVYVGADRSDGALDSAESWYLEDYQRDQLATMLEHIAMGVRLAAEDNNSILLFSGGQTRARAGPRSEALSYWEAAEARGWFGHVDVRERAQLEDQAPRSRRDHAERVTHRWRRRVSGARLLREPSLRHLPIRRARLCVPVARDRRLVRLQAKAL